MRVLQVLLVSLALLAVSTHATLVVAHRGDSASAPENTLPAFALGFEKGANAFETDLRTSSDGYIVLVHDSTLDRTTNCSYTVPTTQCRCGPVNALTLAALKTCDAGIKFGQQWAGTQIPTFEEAVALAKDYGGMIVMDLKVDDQTGGLLGSQINEVVVPYDMSSLVVPSCWNYEQVANMNEYLKMSQKQYLGSAPLQLNAKYFEDQISAGVNGFSLNWNTLSSNFVYQAALRMMPVFSWTINDATDMQAAVAMGISGILTDDVATAVSVVSSYCTGSA